MRCVVSNSELGEEEDLTVKAGDGAVQLVPGGVGMKSRVCDLMKGMPFVENESSQPLFVGSNFPVIDAADARNRGFSVTIARSKTIKVDTVTNLREDLELD